MAASLYNHEIDLELWVHLAYSDWLSVMPLLSVTNPCKYLRLTFSPYNFLFIIVLKPHEAMNFCGDYRTSWEVEATWPVASCPAMHSRNALYFEYYCRASGCFILWNKFKRLDRRTFPTLAVMCHAYKLCPECSFSL